MLIESSSIPVRSVYGRFVSKHLLKKAVEIGGVGEGGRVRLDHGWGVLAQVAQVLLGHLHYHGKSSPMVLVKTLEYGIPSA